MSLSSTRVCASCSQCQSIDTRWTQLQCWNSMRYCTIRLCTSQYRSKGRLWHPLSSSNLGWRRRLFPWRIWRNRKNIPNQFDVSEGSIWWQHRIDYCFLWHCCDPTGWRNDGSFSIQNTNRHTVGLNTQYPRAKQFSWSYTWDRSGVLGWGADAE